LRRNCLLKHVIEEKKEGRIDKTGRRGRKYQQTLDDPYESKRCWKSKEEVLDRTIWRIALKEAMDLTYVRQTT